MPLDLGVDCLNITLGTAMLSGNRKKELGQLVTSMEALGGTSGEKVYFPGSSVKPSISHHLPSANLVPPGIPKYNRY